MPQLPVFQAGPAALGRRADAGDFGGAEAQAAGQRAGVGDALGEIAAKIHEADQSARVSRAVGQASVQLDDLRRSLSQDNDFETHDDRFEKGKAEILKQAGQTIAPGRYQSELQDRLFEISARVRGSVLDTARAKQVDFAKANRAASLQDLSGAAARAQSPEEREAYRKQFAESTSSAVRAGLVGFDEAMSDLRSFDRSVSEADRRAAIEADPVAAFNAMKDPASPLLRGLNEAEAEQWREQAIREQEHQLEQRRAQVGFNEAQEERAKRLADDAAMRNADDLLAKGDIAGLQGYLSQTREMMTPEHRRFYLARIADGGGFQNEKTDPATYLDISRKAAAAQDVSDEADSAFRAGRLSKSDMDAQLKISKDLRFGAAHDYLTRALHVAEAIGDYGAQQKGAQAIADLTDHAIANPHATRAELLQYAQGLAREAALVDFGTMSQLRPRYAVGSDARKIDVDATIMATQAAFERGEIDQAEVTRQNGLVKRWSDLQDRTATGAGQGK